MYFVEKQGADLLNEAIALRVMTESGVDSDLLRGLFEASKHRQILIAKTENGEPLATLAFARISKFTLKLLAGNTGHKLRPYEYGEGKILYVQDAFFRKHTVRKSLALLAPQLKRYRLIAFVRKERLRVFYNGSRSVRPIKLSSFVPSMDVNTR
jgi:hypothetical protein